MSDFFVEKEFPDYLDPIAKKLGKKYDFIDVIAPGNSGITYSLKSKSNSKRFCLKTISPAIKKAPERDAVRETLRKEVEILAPLFHRCLPTIYEHELRGPLPFYICTFHPGAPWEKFRLEKKKLQLSEAIFVIASLVDVLEYLHSEGRTHCDLHGNNILISEKVFAEGILIIDFGSGHRASDDSPYTEDKGFGGFKNIRGQQQHKRRVRRANAMQDFKDYDFTALGKALSGMHDAFFDKAPHDQKNSYLEFCGMLQDGTIRSWTEVKDRFEHVVDPVSLLTKSDHLFVREDGQRQSITLPASSPIPVGEGILDVVNHQTFQKLRGIKQLSFCEWQFPGAVHTRFEHSLGVFGSTKRALEYLVRDSNIKNTYTSKHIEGTLLAALLHDIGHYPFAHAIEHYVAGRFFEDREKYSRAKEETNHFSNSLRIIDADKDLAQTLEKRWSEGVIEETKNILKGNVGILSQLLDGPMDCDKVDYLKRDAWHCGVPYGDGFKTDEVLSAFKSGEDAKKLYVRESHVHAVEGFMIAQDQMLSAVYWQQNVRAVFAMFHGFLAGTVGDDVEQLVEIASALKGCANDFQALTDVFRDIVEKQTKSGSNELWPLIRLHYEPRFTDIYRSVQRFSFDDPIDPKLNSGANVFQSIVVGPGGSLRTGTPIKREQIRRLIQSFRQAYKEKNAAPGKFEVLVDVPWGKNSNRMLEVVDADGRNPKEISLVTHLADSIFKNPTAYSAPIRVFVSPRLYANYTREIGSIVSSALEKYFDSRSKLDEF